MDQYLFAVRNIGDKLTKIAGDLAILKFYWQTYVCSKFDSVEPDVYIVSYPKCGRTWLRVMLGNYLELIAFSSLRFRDRFFVGIPGGRTIKFEHDQGNWVPAPPRIDQLYFDRVKYHQKKVVFLVRNPRDVLVSSWYHLKYREHIYRRGLSAFIRDDLVGIHKVIAFMNIWLENSHVPDGFHLLTYEQLHSDPIFSFRKLLKFMDIPVVPEFLQAAVKESSFEKMKCMEMNGSLKEPWMKPGSKDTDHSVKIRKGKVGEFRLELSIEDIEFLNDVIRSELSSKLSYC